MPVREFHEESNPGTQSDPLERPTIDFAGPGVPVSLVNTSGAGSPITTPHDSKPLPSPPEPRVIGKYTILAKIGMGGMGVVYRAHDPDLHRDVALKMIRSGAFAQPTDIARFLLESKALAQLRHPNIIAIYDAGEEQGEPYFVMEFLPGGSAAGNRDRYPKHPEATVALVEKVARAAGFLHDQNMLHRDLKPGNILLDAAGQPYLSDFGLIKWLDAADDLTRSHQRVGTPAYMAPEQTGIADLPLGPWTDVWAIGIILYEFLTGRRPFEGSSRTIGRDICDKDPPSPRRLNADLDRGLESIILRCLHKDPARRFANATELANELARWRRREPLLTRPPGKVRRALTWTRRHPWRIAVLLLLTVTLITAPAVIVVSDPDRPWYAMRRDFLLGKPITLIGQTGRPEWSRWSLAQPGAISVSPEGAFTIAANNSHVMLELVPEVPAQAYRLRGRIQHQTHALTGSVGVFACASPVPTARGKGCFFAGMSFDDMSSVDARLLAKQKPLNTVPGNSALFFVGGVADVGRPGDPWTGHYGNKQIAAFQPRMQGKSWRDVSITVTAEHVEMVFDGQPGLVRPWGELVQKFDTGIRGRAAASPGFLPEPLPKLEPQGGLGVFVRFGAASFANFVLEPLKPL